MTLKPGDTITVTPKLAYQVADLTTWHVRYEQAADPNNGDDIEAAALSMAANELVAELTGEFPDIQKSIGGRVVSLSAEAIEEAKEALLALDRCAAGDSNDDEIEAGAEVAGILAALVGYEEPPTWTVTDKAGNYVDVIAETEADALYAAARTGELETDDDDDNDLTAERQ